MGGGGSEAQNIFCWQGGGSVSEGHFVDAYGVKVLSTPKGKPKTIREGMAIMY